jgi:hypothetical protein
MITIQAENAVARYLAAQALLAGAIGLCFATLMLATDTAGVRSLAVASGPWTVGVFIVGTVLTVWPLAFATAVGFLSLR